MLSSWIARHLCKVEQNPLPLDDAAFARASRRRYLYMLIATGITCAALSLGMLQLPQDLRSNNRAGLVIALAFAAMFYFLEKARSPNVISALASTLFIIAGFVFGVGLHKTRIWDRGADVGTISTFVFIISVLLFSAAIATSSTAFHRRNLALTVGVVVTATILTLLLLDQAADVEVSINKIVSSIVYVGSGMLMVKVDDERWRDTVLESPQGSAGLDRALGAKAASLLLLFAAASILNLALKVFVPGFW